MPSHWDITEPHYHSLAILLHMEESISQDNETYVPYLKNMTIYIDRVCA